MNNRERAVEVAKEFLDGNDLAAKIITKRLADAGLLAPDLPEPDECPKDIHKPGWHIDILGAEYAGVLAGWVWITNWSGWGHYRTPDEIRVAAHKLLAAANAAEEGNQE